MKKLLYSFLIFLFMSGSAFAGTYYVDFDAGDDTNNGTAEVTPWRTLPGTYGQTTWGAITSSNKIPAPSTIYIKAGTTHSSADPIKGNISINSTYYASPTQESERITITVSPDWGTGHAIINGTGLTYGATHTTQLLSVLFLSYITVRGNDDTRRLKFQNASVNGVWIGGTSGTHRQYQKLNYLYVSNCGIGIGFSYSDNFTVENTYTTLNATAGIMTGGGSGEVCATGTIQNCESNGDCIAPSSSAGICVMDATDVLVKDCTVYGARNNFNYGVQGGTGSCSVTTVNCVSYNTPNAGFRCSGGGPATTDTCVYIYINCIAYDCNTDVGETTGIYHSYNGCTVKWYHCIADRRSGAGGLFTADAEDPYGDVKVYARNNVGYHPSGSGNVWMYRIIEWGATYKVIIDINYNTYDITGLFAFARVRSAGGTWDDKTFTTWKTENRFGGIPDANSSTSTTIDDYWTDVVNHIYTINSASSPLINVGTYLNTPSDVLLDKNGIPRSNPPEVGPYEYGNPSTVQGLIIMGR